MKIRKAVIPAAGLGTRFLPASKAQPKEMLPIVDKPTIQYVVEEAVASGIEQIIVITGRGKRAIEDHFDRTLELENFLEAKGKKKELEQMKKISNLVNICYIRQKEALGLGHAVLTAKDLVGREPFAVLLGDDIIYSEVPCLKQLVKVYNRFKCSVLSIHEVPKDKVFQYGIVDIKQIESNIYKVQDMVEKPQVEKAPSNFAIIGRYILNPEIFDALEETEPDKSGEIQLTNGLRLLHQRQAIYACQFEGTRYDAGEKLGFLKATVELALREKELGKDFAEYLKGLDIDKIMKS
ncbi:UTP--glucose-1-phosphate uridylyltransferase GalU [bacterium]|nr:UTP--glucose-1-phosphate uridylyltransferase GalU [bacterium]